MEYKFKVNDLEVKAIYSKEEVENIFLPLVKKWTLLQKQLNRRIFVFLAAPPGCGKTTLSLFLEYISKQSKEYSEIQAIGMDGFHYTNEYLKNHTFIEEGKVLCLKERKGNYATFDKESLKAMIVEGRNKDNLWPIYSRKLHDPIENQIKLEKNIILIEGNYLLLNKYGWEDLIECCDDSVFVLAKEEELKERLIQRKMAGGLSYIQAEAFYINSDIKNIHLVLNSHHKANTTILMEHGKFTLK